MPGEKMTLEEAKEHLTKFKRIEEAIQTAPIVGLRCTDPVCPKAEYRVDSPIRICARGGSTHRVAELIDRHVLTRVLEEKP